MVIHHATTPINSAIAITDVRRWRESQSAQTSNAAKAAANPRRSAADGGFE